MNLKITLSGFRVNRIGVLMGALVAMQSVLATDALADAQGQARALLSGQVTQRIQGITHAGSASDDSRDLPPDDAQTQARRLLAGRMDAGLTRARILQGDLHLARARPTGQPRGARVWPDSQENARRMILGHGN